MLSSMSIAEIVSSYSPYEISVAGTEGPIRSCETVWGHSVRVERVRRKALIPEKEGYDAMRNLELVGGELAKGLHTRVLEDVVGDGGWLLGRCAGGDEE